MRPFFTCLPFLLLTATLLSPSAAKSKSYDGVLSQPLVLGAWLYQGKCTSCHGDYGSARLAEEYDDEKALYDAIGFGGCRQLWSSRAGGPLSHVELEALARFMTAWDAAGQQPDLPPLPPQPAEERPPEPKQTIGKVAAPAPALSKDDLPPELRKLVNANPVVMGGWLYTMNCHRCHLDYAVGRMGKGLESDAVFRFISEGKTSTQMTAFSRLLGGKLKNSEIQAIVKYISAWEKAGEPLAIAERLMTPPALDPAEFRPARLTRFKAVTGDTGHGRRHYLYHCSVCHGRDGEGYIGSSLRTSGWTMRPDLYIKSIVKSGIPGSPMASWEKGGTSLSPKAIDDLVSYITSAIITGEPR